MHSFSIVTISRFLLGACLLTSTAATSVELVSDATIKEQMALTEKLELKNGIPVFYRKVPGSDIINIVVTFKHGLIDLRPGRKALSQWLWSTMPISAKGYPKEKVFELTEQYALELGCGGGIEYSTCSLGTLDDHWSEALPLFAAVVKNPAFDDKDINIYKERLVAQLKASSSDPGRYVNEVVNEVFYPKGHPYRNTTEEALDEIGKLTRADLIIEHKNVLNAKGMTLIVVGSMDSKELLASLNGAFQDIAGKEIKRPTVEAPPFDEKTSYKFESRAIPTAYIRAKVTSPSITDKDATATRLMYEILSEELGEEIRTRRSLSYAVYSYIIQYSLGIGVLSASTSKPKETLEAMNAVINRVKSNTYSAEELAEYKRGFATNYFLTLETHASLAGAIANSVHYFGTPNELYEFPKKLEAVTPAQIKQLANDLLVDLRLGVIFDRKEFKDEWAQDLIKKSRKPSTH